MAGLRTLIDGSIRSAPDAGQMTFLTPLRCQKASAAARHVAGKLPGHIAITEPK
jgi:hypothetical protein